MAGDWIKVEMSTLDKPEVLRLAHMLGVSRAHILGCLLTTWCWFDRNSVDGRVNGAVPDDIDTLVGLPGFAFALCFVRWFDISDLGEDWISMSNFDRHNGESAKKRALSSRRMQRFRYARSVTEASPEKRTEEKSISPPTPSLDISH